MPGNWNLLEREMLTLILGTRYVSTGNKDTINWSVPEAAEVLTETERID